jgi:hypothetical protein
VELDDKPMFETVMHPTGLSKDGVSTVYKRFELKAGTYKLAVKMNDNLVVPGFNFVKEEQVTLKPAQVLVIDFNPDKGGLFFQQAARTETMLTLLQKIVRWFFMRAENLFNVAFGEKLNPFYHLGTISFWQFWLLIGTGLYLYIFADTAVHDAYESVERITHSSGGPAASCAASTAMPPTA